MATEGKKSLFYNSQFMFKLWCVQTLNLLPVTLKHNYFSETIIFANLVGAFRIVYVGEDIENYRPSFNPSLLFCSFRIPILLWLWSAKVSFVSLESNSAYTAT